MAKLAALSSGLLARKGQARPAMRPQGYNYAASIDDLGWNDMGQPALEPTPAVVPEPRPPVLVEREALAQQVEQTPEPVQPVAEPAAPAPEAAERRPVSIATATRIRRETAQAHKRGTKAAFTLRLDAERHLKLRLASAIADESAQALMTEALDALLDTMPEVEALVAQLPQAKRR